MQPSDSESGGELDVPHIGRVRDSWSFSPSISVSVRTKSLKALRRHRDNAELVWTKAEINTIKSGFDLPSDAAARELGELMFLSAEMIESRSDFSADSVHNAVVQYWARTFGLSEKTPVDQIRAAIVSRAATAASRKRKATSAEVALADTPVLMGLAEKLGKPFLSRKVTFPVLLSHVFDFDELTPDVAYVPPVDAFLNSGATVRNAGSNGGGDDPVRAKRVAVQLLRHWHFISVSHAAVAASQWASRVVSVAPGELKDGNLIVIFSAASPASIERTYQFLAGGVWSPLAANADFECPPAAVWAFSSAGLASVSERLLQAGWGVPPVAAGVNLAGAGFTLSESDAVGKPFNDSSHTSSALSVGGNGARIADLLRDHESGRMVDRNAKCVGFLNCTRGVNSAMVDVVLSRARDINSPSVVATVHALLSDSQAELPGLVAEGVPSVLNFVFRRKFQVSPINGLHLQHLSPRALVTTSDVVIAVSCAGNIADRLYHTCQDSSSPPAFMSDLLKQLIQEIQFPGVTALHKYCVPFQAFFANNLLVEFSKVINSNVGEAAGWSREELSARLRAVSVMPSKADLTAMFIEWDMTRTPPVAVRSVPNKGPRLSIERPSRLREKDVGTKVLTPKPSTTVPPQAAASGVSRRPCHQALAFFAGAILSNCSRPNCKYIHNYRPFSKDELRQFASLNQDEALRKTVIEKIACM